MKSILVEDSKVRRFFTTGHGKHGAVAKRDADLGNQRRGSFDGDLCLSLLSSASVSTIPVTSTRVLKNVHAMLFCEHRAICGTLTSHACFVANAMNSPDIFLNVSSQR
jgi:hypothetical protein